ncbi:MAG TPA: exodeoxyribonuclease VII large subunit [Gemmatimonadales bacterium]
MGRELSFDFGSAVAAEGAWTVGQVTRRARDVIEAGVPALWIRGEITGFKAQSGGQWYFTLRDATAKLSCVMWGKENRRLHAPPDEGVQVFAYGRPTVWEKGGQLQLQILELLSTEAGGLWQVSFEKAKAALAKDGLLDPTRKRALPPYPRRIAMITSVDGAALRDVMAVLARRWPAAELLVLPTKVQGENAAGEVRAALALLGRLEGVDVAIVGRGGGGKEDLWAFNDERLARAVAASPVPIISAVGHETDVTLCDLVADHRAATPSAAAEAATPDRLELLGHLDHLGSRLAHGLAGRSQRARERLARSGDRLTTALERRVERLGHRLAEIAGRLDALSPLKVLERGYAVARNAHGAVLRRVGQFTPGLAFRLRVADGEVPAKVRES